MGNQGHSSRQNGPQVKRARMAPVRAPARKSNGNDDTNRAPQLTQRSRPQQHSQSRVPHEQIATAPSPASSRQQTEDLEYGSQRDDGTVMEDIENASEASLGSGDQDVGLAAAISALSICMQTLGGQLQTFGGHLQTNNTLMQRLLDEMTTNNRHSGELRAATRVNTSTVKTMMDWFKLHNLPSVNPVPGYDGTGPATFTHRNLPPGPPGPPDQGGTGQFASNGLFNN